MPYRISLFILIVISFYIPAYIYPLFDYDEGAFAEATREMLSSGDYITTYLNGKLRFDKPILIYWFQAFSIKLFGLNEFAVRLPSLIASSIWVGAVFIFVKRFFDEKKAFLAAVFMLSSLQINIIAKAAIADALLNMAIALSMFLIWSYLDKREKKYLYLAFFTIGIGTLTKGPVAILIPLAVTFFYLVIKKDMKLFFQMVFDIKGILIFLSVVFPWYFLEYLEQGEKFINGFFLKHNLQRFNSSMEHHSGNFLYYIIVLLFGFLPFSRYLFKVFKNIKNIIKTDLNLFLIVWFFFVYIFFSLSSTKLPHYIIYGYTPMFILMAYYFDKIDIYTLLVLNIFLIFFFFFPELALFLKYKLKDLYALSLIDNIKNHFDSWYKLYIAIAIVSSIFIYKSSISQLNKVFLYGLIFSLLFNYVIVNSFAKLTQEPLKEIALISKKNGYKTIMYKINMPAFLFYTQRLNRYNKYKEGDYIFTKVSELHRIKKYKTLYKKNGMYLIKVEK